MKLAVLALTVAATTLTTNAFAKDWQWNYEMGRGSTSPASGTQRPTSGKNLAELEQQKDGSYEFRVRGNTATSRLAAGRYSDSLVPTATQISPRRS